MKKLLTLCIAVLITGLTFAQSPNSFNYQAVARDAAGQLITEKNVSLRISILETSSTGTQLYQETHTTMTNKFGVLNLAVGNGTLVSGNFTTILWGGDKHFIKVEMDASGGSTFIAMGTQQLLSVPYALNAKTADGISGGVQVMEDKDGDTKIVLDQTADDDKIHFRMEGAEYLTMDKWRISVLNSGNNVALGGSALTTLKKGAENTALGQGSMQFADTLDGSVAVGFNTLRYAKGTQNTALGAYSMYDNISGNFNTAAGAGSLYNNIVGSFNTTAGYRSMFNADSGSYNVSYGYFSLFNNKAKNNTAIGPYTLYANKSGGSNIALGYSALRNSDDASYNIGIGIEALEKNKGDFNIGIGINTLKSNAGTKNTAIGHNALKSVTTANNNTALGYGAGESFKGTNSTFLGINAGPNKVSGVFNVFLGENAGGPSSSGSDNIALGSYSNISPTAANSIVIGTGASVIASNQARIGNSATSSIGGYASWSNLSDGRFKTNVKEDVRGLDFILNLRPVTFNLKTDEIAAFLGEDRDSANGRALSQEMLDARKEKASITQTGFIAQEVEATAKELGFEFSGVDAPKNENDHYSLRYAEFTVPLVKAVQEQQEIIETQKTEIELLKERLAALEKLMLELNKLQISK